MARNVGPSMFEARIGKSMQRHTGKLILGIAGLAVVSLLLMSGEYVAAYEGVVEAVKAESFNRRGRKNKGVYNIEEKCLVIRIDGEEEPHRIFGLPPDVLERFAAGQRVSKQRFRQWPTVVEPAPAGGPVPGAP